jgi:hypothetical protein
MLLEVGNGGGSLKNIDAPWPDLTVARTTPELFFIPTWKVEEKAFLELRAGQERIAEFRFSSTQRAVSAGKKVNELSNRVAQDIDGHVRQLTIALEYLASLKSCVCVGALTPNDVVAAFVDTVITKLDTALLQKLFSVSEPIPGIILLQCPCQELLAATFLRFQEHYESPRWQGLSFSLSEYRNWYRKQSYAQGFSYYQDWGGFNIPDYALERAAGFVAKNATPAEQFIIELLSNHTKPYYVIGGGLDHETIRHEIAHALYYLDPNYRIAVSEIIGNYSLKRLRAALLKAGYTQERVEDELQAYLTDNPADLYFSYGISENWYQEARSRLGKVFIEHLKMRNLNCGNR